MAHVALVQKAADEIETAVFFKYFGVNKIGACSN
jgi:hypothetical protein